LIAGPRVTSVAWLTIRLKFELMGPAATFTPDAATRVANAFQAAA